MKTENNNIHYSKENIENFENLIKNENDYKLLINSLWQTRAGLHKIIQTRSDLRNSISDQFETLNNIIEALLPAEGSNYEYPPYKI